MHGNDSYLHWTQNSVGCKYAYATWNGKKLDQIVRRLFLYSLLW